MMEEGFKAAVSDSISIKAPWALLTGRLSSDAARKMSPAVVGAGAGPQLSFNFAIDFPLPGGDSHFPLSC